MNLNSKAQWSDRTVQQLVSYEALFKLIDEIQPLEDIGEISKLVARQWKYFANVACWRLVVPKDVGFLIIDGFRGDARITDALELSPWDAHHLDRRLPRRIRMTDPMEGPEAPEHLAGKAIAEIEVLPFERAGRCIGVLSVAARHEPFTELDNRFIRIFGSHFTDRISDLLLRRRAMEALLNRATRDGLTGLLNRGTIIERLDMLLGLSRRTMEPISVILADIDFFKAVNDNHGHLVGDEVLCKVSQRLQSQTRVADQLGRYGGEEFLFVLYPCNSNQASIAAERFRRAVADEPTPIGNDGSNGIRVTISLGTATSVGQAEPGRESLLKRADEALYRSKTSGRNRVTVG
jgi:diguanylate cyclase (GGDEF)-like protein